MREPPRALRPSRRVHTVIARRLVLLSVALLPACATAAHLAPRFATGGPLGSSSGDAMLSASASTSTLGPFLVPSLSSLVPVGSGSYVSFGHGPGRYREHLYATAPALVLAPASASVGFVACALQEEPQPSSKPLLTCMRKELPGELPASRDWRYGVAMGNASTWLREGALPDCSDCHRASRGDSLYAPRDETGR